MTITYKIGECSKELYYCKEGINRFINSLVEIIINSEFNISQILHLLKSKLEYETYWKMARETI